MYLVDTNIFLEILLEQNKAEECEILLSKINQSNTTFYVSSFTLHSIEVIMIRNNRINELIEFLSDIASSRISRVDTTTNDELNILKAIKRLRLDFDDSIQYYICEKYKLKIISYDKHFDMSEIYHWFITSGQSPLSSFGMWYISEHAQKWKAVSGANMPPMFHRWSAFHF